MNQKIYVYKFLKERQIIKDNRILLFGLNFSTHSFFLLKINIDNLLYRQY